MIKIQLDVPHENLMNRMDIEKRAKALLLAALEDMVTNNGHLIDDPKDYALAKLIVEGKYEEEAGEDADPMTPEHEAQVRDLAKQAGVL